MMPNREERRALVRAHVLDAAERLLRADEGAAFSMRELAAEAAVSFATPFNQFGGKAAILHALSSRRIDKMTARLRAAPAAADAPARVLAAVPIAAGVLLEEPVLNRALIGSLGAPSRTPGAVGTRSGALWSLALDDYRGIDPVRLAFARTALPEQLALVFRGCLSFWAAGEIGDNDLIERAGAAAAIALLAFADAPRRQALLVAAGSRQG